jgi:hypothetical protein
VRWRGVHHCERCGQPQVRERLLDAARSVLLYERELKAAATAEARERWARAMMQQEQLVREELEHAARERQRVLAPLDAAPHARPAEWRPLRLEAAPPPPEFHALRDALASLRRLTPEPSPAERGDQGEPPTSMRPLLDLADRW